MENNMKNAILLHGTSSKEEYYSLEYPSASNSHWLPWLQKNLLVNDIHAVTPEMLNGFNPDYDVWCREFERYDITSETILVGHSCGGGFLLRWLSEHPDIKVDKVILVAPWLDPTRRKTIDFFDFTLDSNLVDRTRGVTVFSSNNDSDEIIKSVQIISEQVPNIKIKEFLNYGHFCYEDMKTVEFPELLEEILS